MAHTTLKQHLQRCVRLAIEFEESQAVEAVQRKDVQTARARVARANAMARAARRIAQRQFTAA